MSSVPLKVSWVPYQRRQFNFIDGTIAEIKLDSGWDYCTKCKIKEWKCHRGIAWWICDNHFEKNPFSIFFFGGFTWFGWFIAGVGWIWFVSKAIIVVHLLACLHSVRILCIQSAIYGRCARRLLVQCTRIEWF